MNRGMKMVIVAVLLACTAGSQGGAGGIGERQGGIGKRDYSGAADENAGGRENDG